MAKVIHRLWKTVTIVLLILPGSLPLYEADTRNEMIYHLPQGWDPVLERDIDGERAETTDIENRDTRLGSVQACRRIARTIFLGSAPTTANQMVRGLEQERVISGHAQPGQQSALYKDALRRWATVCIISTVPITASGSIPGPTFAARWRSASGGIKIRKTCFPPSAHRLQKSFASGVFGGIHVFTASGDVPDDWSLRLVVLPRMPPTAKADNEWALTGLRKPQKPGRPTAPEAEPPAIPGS